MKGDPDPARISLGRSQRLAAAALVAFRGTVADTPSPGLDRAALIEDLIAWSTDPNGMDREAMEHVESRIFRSSWRRLHRCAP